MATLDPTTYFFYRRRYVLGYTVIGILLVALIVFAGLYIPGGLSRAEMNSAVASNALSLNLFSNHTVTNLPYYLLQKASLHYLGVSDFSIKLPSLVLGFFSAVGLVLLLRRWFAQNIAILSSIIAITTSQFVFIAQSGNPSILYLFWPVWVFYLGTLVANKRYPAGLFKVLFFIVAALSLYTPLSIFPLIALGSATLLHPHLRYIVLHLSKIKLLLGVLVAAILLIPLGHMIILHPVTALTMLGIPTKSFSIAANALQLSQQFFGFINPAGTTLMTPAFGLGSILIIVIGLIFTIRTRETAKSYTIFFWLILLIIVLFLSPGFTSVTFLPLVLLLSSGMGALLDYWYRLFPRNPYARIGGLLPVIILVVSLVASGVTRYAYGYHYDPNVATSFSQDINLLPPSTRTIVVSKSEEPFYEVIAAHDKKLVVTMNIPSTGEFTVTHNANTNRLSHKIIEKVITSSMTEDSDRYYLYKN